MLIWEFRGKGGQQRAQEWERFMGESSSLALPCESARRQIPD
jgi:hypothetical protein